MGADTTYQDNYSNIPKYNDNHSLEKQKMGYDDLSKEERLQIDCNFLTQDNILLEKKNKVMQEKISSAIQFLEDYKKSNESALPGLIINKLK